MQVVLDLREKELEAKQMEMAKILAVLNEQRGKLQTILANQDQNRIKLEELCSSESLDVTQVESYRNYGIKLAQEATNQQRLITNTEVILEKKQQEVLEAHKNVEVLKKLKEKQEKEYYQEFLNAEMKEIDDITSSRFRL